MASASATKDIKSNKPVESDKRVTILYSNITSLSNHAQEFLLALLASVSVLMLCELHKEASVVNSVFKPKGFSVSYNSLEDTLKGTHGEKQSYSETVIRVGRSHRNISS